MARVVDRIAAIFRDAKVHRLFGVPGGGSIAELIEAAGRVGLPFTLAHTETAAALMACAQAELGTSPGVALATLGPGAASLINGVAHAWLDRIPLIAVTDCLGEPAPGAPLHQRLPQSAMFAPITKWTTPLDPCSADEQLARAIAISLDPPAGPVHLDLSSDSAVAESAECPAATRPVPRRPRDPLSSTISSVVRVVRKPVVLAGLGSRGDDVAEAIARLVERHGIPALVTYKAKGVVPDVHSWYAGILTNGALERPILEAADLFLAIGLDSVELLPRPWRYTQPMIHVAAWEAELGQLPSAGRRVGNVPELLAELGQELPNTTDWDVETVRRVRDLARDAMRVPGEQVGGKLRPHRVVELVAGARSADRVTVDAGAHMFPALALWPVSSPRDLLISNGLSTMGYALPTAIGATLLDRRPTTVLTGDGGLAMCLAELRTVAQERLPIRIIVFDDQALSLIKIKQEQRGFRTEGVGLDGIDWPTLARSLGVPGWRVTSESELTHVLEATARVDGPALIAAEIDASGYRATMNALRG